MEWRTVNKIDQIDPEDNDIEIEERTGRSKILRKPDLCGRPVVYFRVRNHDKNHGNIERVQKHTIYTFEELGRIADETTPDGRFTAVFDLKGFSYRNMDLDLVFCLGLGLEFWLDMDPVTDPTH